MSSFHGAFRCGILACVVLYAKGAGGGGGQYKCGAPADMAPPQSMVFGASFEDGDGNQPTLWTLTNGEKGWDFSAPDKGECQSKGTNFTGDIDDKFTQTLRCIVVEVARPCRNWCHDEGSFLGVGNPICIGQNVVTSAMLVTMIIVLSLFFSWIEETLRERCSGSPQMRAIHAHMVQEVTILGFISMVVFVFQQNGVTDALAANDSTLGPSELFHFKEFFHFVIFLTMLCYITTVLVLLHVSQRFPQLWHVARREDRDGEAYDDTVLGDGENPTPRATGRGLSPDSETSDGGGGGGDGDGGGGSGGRERSASSSSNSSSSKSRTRKVLDEYLVVEKRLARHPWGTFWRKLDLPLQMRLYRAVNRVAFRLCKSQAKDVYSSRRLMHAMFDTSMDLPRSKLNFTEYSLRATQLLLVEVLEVHWTNWAAVLVLLAVNAVRVKAGASVNMTGADDDASGGDRGTAVFVAGGVALVLANVAICYKGWTVLQRVVETRIPVSLRRWRDIGRLIRPVLLAIGQLVVLRAQKQTQTRSTKRLRTLVGSGRGAPSGGSALPAAQSSAGVEVESMLNLLQVSSSSHEVHSPLASMPETTGTLGDSFADEEVDVEESDYDSESESLAYKGRGDSDVEDDGTDSDDVDDTDEQKVPEKKMPSLRDEPATRKSSLGSNAPSSGRQSLVVDKRFHASDAGVSDLTRTDRLVSVKGSGELSADADYNRFFWFGRPELLVRGLQFTIFFQAIYLAFFFLMFAKRGVGANAPWGGAAVAIQLLCPALILLVITPLSLPLFVVLLDLIGYLGEEKVGVGSLALWLLESRNIAHSPISFLCLPLLLARLCVCDPPLDGTIRCFSRERERTRHSRTEAEEARNGSACHRVSSRYCWPSWPFRCTFALPCADHVFRPAPLCWHCRAAKATKDVALAVGLMSPAARRGGRASAAVL